jgi:hypothetical protein
MAISIQFLIFDIFCIFEKIFAKVVISLQTPNPEKAEVKTFVNFETIFANFESFSG